MLNSYKNLIILSMMVIGLVGCRLFSDGKPSVVVEEVSLIQKEGIELETVSATHSAFFISEPQVIGRTIASKSVSDRFHIVPNKAILDALKSKLGTNFLSLQEKFESVRENDGDFSRYPELGVEYKFIPSIEGLEIREAVCFKLREAFEGLGVLIAVKGDQIHLWAGNPRLFRSVNGAESELVVDLFDSKIGVPVYRVAMNSFFGFQKSPGGSVFLLAMNEDRFQLKSVVSTPSVVNAVTIYPDRMNASLAKLIGAPSTADGFLVYYTDAHQEVVKIFHMDRNFIFRDVSNSCGKLWQNDLLPASMSCRNQSAKL